MSFFLLLNTKEDILIGTTVDFHSRKKTHYGSQWCQSSNRSSKFLCVNQKKETHTGLQQLEGELMMTEFSFLGGVSL